jgi:tetratricopeptide (TPR) repeat protein
VISAIKDVLAAKSPTCRRAAQHVILRAGHAHDHSGHRTRAHAAAPRLFACWLALVTAAIGSSNARASDFWDELRTPGLAAQRAHLRRGRQELNDNRPESALTEADAAIGRCASCADGIVLRARAFAALARFADAADSFEQALAVEASALDADVRDALSAAISAGQAGRPALVVRVLERALTRSLDRTSRTRATVMLADALQAQGPSELRRAIVTYREAMLEDDGKLGLLGLALALDRGGDHDEALALARRIPNEAGPNASASWLSASEQAARLGLWLASIGDAAAAEQAWRHAAEGTGAWQAHADKARNEAARAAGKP